MEDKKEVYMKMALSQAKLAHFLGEVPIGSVLVADGEVLAKTHNMCITLLDPTAHAEVLAIREACKKVGNYRLCEAFLYTTCEPCVMCFGAIVNARIKGIIYGCKDTKAGAFSKYELDKKKINHKFFVIGGVLEDEAANLLRNFFESIREERYRSGHNGVDSKSTGELASPVGSNPTLSVPF